MEPVARISILSEVVRKLKDHITGGDFEVGDRFPTEGRISATLQVGRSTVREALRVLETLGFLTIRVGKGAYVAATSRDSPPTDAHWFADHRFELADFFEVRMVTEPFAVQLAASRVGKGEIRKLEKLHESFKEALAEGDGLRLATLDEAFHGAIAEASHNRLLVTVQKNINRYFFEYRYRIFSARGYPPNALEPHCAILDSIRRGDGERARRQMIAHLEISLKDLSEITRKESPPKRPAKRRIQGRGA